MAKEQILKQICIDNIGNRELCTEEIDRGFRIVNFKTINPNESGSSTKGGVVIVLLERGS